MYYGLVVRVTWFVARTTSLCYDNKIKNDAMIFIKTPPNTLTLPPN
jgi:hypothetical protein